MEHASILQREPDFHAASTTDRVELVAVALEIRGVCSTMARLGQPFVPDRMPGGADGGNMATMLEHGIVPGSDTQAAPAIRNSAKIIHGHGAQIVEMAGVVIVAAHAIHQLASGNMGQETLPQGRNAGTGFRP